MRHGLLLRKRLEIAMGILIISETDQDSVFHGGGSWVAQVVWHNLHGVHIRPESQGSCPSCLYESPTVMA